MAYLEFSSDNADYVLQASQHGILNSNWKIFKGIDALVLESGECENLEQVMELGELQMDIPIAYCAKTDTPIFNVDCNVSEYRGVECFVVKDFINFFTGLDLEDMEIYDWNEVKVSEKSAKKFSNRFFAFQEVEIAFRNASAARKIEEWVIPHLGKEHPKIGMIYGSAHIGLFDNLQSKKRRDLTIWNWKHLNFRKYGSINREELYRIDKATFPDPMNPKYESFNVEDLF